MHKSYEKGSKSREIKGRGLGESSASVQADSAVQCNGPDTKSQSSSVLRPVEAVTVNTWFLINTPSLLNSKSCFPERFT